MLTAEPILGGYALELGDVSVDEVTDIAIVSIATPLDGDKALKEAVTAAWGVNLPKPGKSAKKGDITIISSSADQYLAIMPGVEGLAVTSVAKALGDAGYYTEQTDNWVGLRLSGPKSVAALERICPLDIETMPRGAAVRTVMEHLGVFLVKEGPTQYLLLSGSSSAKSFLHAVELSMRNVT